MEIEELKRVRALNQNKTYTTCRPVHRFPKLKHASKVQHTGCMGGCMGQLLQLYQKVTDGKKTIVLITILFEIKFSYLKRRVLVSCDDFEAIMTLFSEVIRNRGMSF